MAISALLTGLVGAATGAGKAYNAYKEASEKKTNSTKNTSTPLNEHQQYIQESFAGGYDDYKRIQQSRYETAYKTGNYDLMSKLDQDAQRVGYYLNAPQAQQQIQQPIFENPYEDYMKQLESKYADLNNQIANQNKAAVQQGVSRLQSQIPTLNQGFDDAARQAYIASMQSRRALPQQLAVQGATGGATETASLGLETSYQNNLNNINTQRQNSINDINNAITDLQNSGDLSTAEQILQNNQNALGAYQSMINNSAQYNQWLANYNANREDTQWNQDYQVGRDVINDDRYNNEYANSQKQQEYNNILNRLSMGLITPNDAVSLGVPAADVQSYVNRIIAQQNAQLANTISLTNKRNESNDNNENPVLSTADKYLGQGNRVKAIEALSAIYTHEQVKQYLESKGYRTDDIDWGIEEVPSLSYRQPTNPALSIENIAAFLKSQGLSHEEIAKRLSR